MRTPVFACTVLALCVLLFGCTTVKRFKSASYKGEENTLADISLFGISLDDPKASASGKSLWDLSASAQTQFIQILNERYGENEDFTRAMNREYLLSGHGPALDFTRKDLKMVFSISRTLDASSLGSGIYSPADRIEELSFSLELPETAGIRFREWNRYTTEYGEIELAEMSFNRSVELEVQASGELVEGGLKTGKTRGEEQVLRSRYLKLSASISDLKLEVTEQGTREMDLTGNVEADVSLLFDAFVEKVCIPQEGTLRFIDVKVPCMEEAPEEIMASLEMEYIYRHVQSGWKTYQEWDDQVAYYKGRISREVKLFKKEDYVPELFGIGREDGRGKQWLRVRQEDGAEYPLQFLGIDDARRFYDDLAKLSGKQEEVPGEALKIGACTLLSGDAVLTLEDLGIGAPLKVMSRY